MAAGTDQESGKQEINLEEVAKLIEALEQDLKKDRKSTRLNSSHIQKSRMPSSA